MFPKGIVFGTAASAYQIGSLIFPHLHLEVWPYMTSYLRGFHLLFLRFSLQ